MSILTTILNATIFLPLIFGSNEVKVGSRVEISTNAPVGAYVQAFDLTTGEWLGADTSDEDAWVEFTAVVGNGVIIWEEEGTKECYNLPVDAVNPVNGKAELRFQDRTTCP